MLETTVNNNLRVINTNDNVNDIWKRFQNQLSKVINQHTNVRPKKQRWITDKILGTTKKLVNLKTIQISGEVIEFKQEAKFLGITLDHKLLWNRHIQCRSLAGKT